MFVEGAVERFVNSAAEAYQVLNFWFPLKKVVRSRNWFFFFPWSMDDVYIVKVLSVGWRNRRVASTSMNRESSRSHAVFSMTLESKESINEVVNIRTSQLNLVDLAGSERQRDTHTEGSRLKVTICSQNLQLTILGNYFQIFSDNKLFFNCLSFRRPAVSTAPSCAWDKWSWRSSMFLMGRTATFATEILSSPFC